MTDDELNAMTYEEKLEFIIVKTMKIFRCNHEEAMALLPAWLFSPCAPRRPS
jgi:hypothetical protein